MGKQKVKKQKVESVMIEEKNEILDEKSELDSKVVDENSELDSEVVDENSEEKTLPNETKETKFIRLAQKRMSKVLLNLKSLGKLSNKNNYVYTEKQISQIFVALGKNMEILRSKFSNAKTEKPVFVF